MSPTIDMATTTTTTTLDHNKNAVATNNNNNIILEEESSNANGQQGDPPTQQEQEEQHEPSQQRQQQRQQQQQQRGRRRMPKWWLFRIVIGLVIVLSSNHFLWNYWLAGVFVSDYEIDPITGQKKYRRHSDQLYKIDQKTQEKVPTDFLDAILEGYLTLIDISLPHPKDGLIPQQPAQLMMNPQQTMNQTSTTPFATNSSYQGVTATFCHIAWDLQQRNPSLVPTFHDLQQQSMLCPGTMIHNVDLYSLVQQAKAYDDDLLPMHDARHRRYHQVVAQPTAVLFHETRCGSTLFSNLITASLPAQVRSYSESKPPLVALMACDLLSSSSSSSSSSSNPYRRPPVCNHESQLQLIRDVFYMMGRMARPQHPQYVFYKMQSIGVRYIHLLTTALPNVSWTFLFRDSVEILMSHFHEYQHQHSHIQKQQQQKQQSKTTTKKRKKGQDKEEEEDKQEKEQHYHDTPSLEEEPHFWKKSRNPSSARPVCLRSYGKHRQDPTLVQVVQTYAPGRNVSSLTPEEYCAAHLATLAQTAVTEYHYTMKDQEEQQQQQQLEGEDEEITKNLIAQFHRKQWFLSYPKLPHVIWERWLPVMLHMGAVSRDMKDRMQVMANVYSKTQGGSTTSSSRTSTQQQSWYEDSTLKQGRAPESLKKAAQLFLDPIYQTMTDIEASQQVH